MQRPLLRASGISHIHVDHRQKRLKRTTAWMQKVGWVSGAGQGLKINCTMCAPRNPPNGNRGGSLWWVTAQLTKHQPIACGSRNPHGWGECRKPAGSGRGLTYQLPRTRHRPTDPHASTHNWDRAFFNGLLSALRGWAHCRQQGRQRIAQQGGEARVLFTQVLHV